MAMFAREQNRAGRQVLVPVTGPRRLTPSEAHRRWYPQAGKIDSGRGVDELVHLVENDRSLDSNRKRQRLQYMYALAHTADFKKDYHGNLSEAEDKLQRAYRRYTKAGMAAHREE